MSNKVIECNNACTYSLLEQGMLCVLLRCTSLIQNQSFIFSGLNRPSDLWIAESMARAELAKSFTSDLRVLPMHGADINTRMAYFLPSYQRVTRYDWEGVPQRMHRTLPYPVCSLSKNQQEV